MEKHVYKRTIYLLTILIWLAIPFDTLATFRYVKPTATGTGTGLSWADASADLQGMINLSVNGDEVWVMAGTYFPTCDGSGNASPADPRTRTFLIRSGVKVYGSFAGTETSTADRVNIWTTILSGNLGTLSNANDNAYRVVSFANQSDANLLDNFSIRNGYDNQSSSPSGGGIYFNDETSTYSPATSPVINQCELAFNQNGGLYVGSYNLPTITGCSFSFNTEGAVRNQPFSQPTFSDCTFYSNTTSTEGGAVSNIGCMPLFKTCKFLGNSTQSSRTDIYITGGAMFNKGSDVVLRSCLFDGNTALYAGGPSVVLLWEA
ncbi:right-handed parallel beta-helix repeat-containing protein [Spirosoma sp. KNUC1025]|uniref:right-handed parallel beta-helix repeat-containing protein n=1 Tax=Spirosoma sp. KNUC1025 TaxID=2894082 RepID=UPI00386743A1|nr:right-handed parallel beta-helix repeat-containing protein [Spirosoma sp. KNUC1025]